MTRSLRFCFSFVKKLFPFHCLKGIVAGLKILGWQVFFFFFQCFGEFPLSPAYIVSDENSLNSHLCFSVCDLSFFLCLLSKLSCYHLFLAIWLWCILVWGFYVNPDWSLLTFLNLWVYNFSQIYKISSHHFQMYSFCLFLSLFVCLSLSSPFLLGLQLHLC